MRRHTCSRHKDGISDGSPIGFSSIEPLESPYVFPVKATLENPPLFFAFPK